MVKIIEKKIKRKKIMILKTADVLQDLTTYEDALFLFTNKTGRFPTQLFCNIKNDRFKYVKNILGD